MEVSVNDKINMEFLCGASLAHHGLLSSVKPLKLKDVDLSQVPSQHLRSLIFSVLSHLIIENLTCDLANLITSLKCYELNIRRQRLGKEETQALVQAMAMESRVVKVKLGAKVTLDIQPAVRSGL